MKKIYVLAAIMMIAAVSIFVMAKDDLGTYASIAQARNSAKRVKIAAQLAKDMPIIYNPAEDPNVVSFHIRDEEGNVQSVKLLQPKPQDFEQSEQVVLTGRMQDGEFLATDVLLKCPSKYKDEELNLKNKQEMGNK